MRKISNVPRVGTAYIFVTARYSTKGTVITLTPIAIGFTRIILCYCNNIVQGCSTVLLFRSNVIGDVVLAGYCKKQLHENSGYRVESAMTETAIRPRPNGDGRRRTHFLWTIRCKRLFSP